MSNVQILWPEIDQLIVPPASEYIDVHNVLARCELRVEAAIKSGRKPKNILFNSNHGLGKTLLAATLANNLRTKHNKKIPMVVFDCSEDTKEYHLKGSFTVQPDGSTAFVPGPIPLAIWLANETGFSMLCLEEISALTPGAQKVVNSITDWRNGVYVAQIGQFLRLQSGAQILVVGTMNPATYGGVNALNMDLRSRFVEEFLPWPTAEQEKKILKALCPAAPSDLIEQATLLGKETRTRATEYHLSTRELVTLIDDLVDLPAQKEAALMCVVNKFQGANERSLVADRVDGVFKTRIKDKIKEQLSA